MSEYSRALVAVIASAGDAGGVLHALREWRQSRAVAIPTRQWLRPLAELRALVAQHRDNEAESDEAKAEGEDAESILSLCVSSQAVPAALAALLRAEGATRLEVRKCSVFLRIFLIDCACRCLVLRSWCLDHCFRHETAPFLINNARAHSGKSTLVPACIRTIWTTLRCAPA